MSDDPLAVLGLRVGATLADVRAARRRLAKELHPDAGGDPTRMRELNVAFDAAVKAILHPETGVPAHEPEPAPEAAAAPSSGPRRPLGDRQVGRWIEWDEPSFSVQALPVETFEALLVVTSWFGEVLEDDPPYVLVVHLFDPAECVVRLYLVPEAGGSMVSLATAAVEGGPWPIPTAEEIRDLYVAGLNELGRPDH